MACTVPAVYFPRISARRGEVVDLNNEFFFGGRPTNPYAIRKVEIYKTSVIPGNLIATIPVVDPCDPIYPSPLCQPSNITPIIPPCDSTASSFAPVVNISGGILEGQYHLYFHIPNDFACPDVYIDVWHYYATDPCEHGTGCPTCPLDDPANEAKLLKCCHQFWVYPDSWFCDDGLETIRFGFEPLDQKFYSPEFRPLEVGLMPLPLYDYNYNLVDPMIPFLQPYITIMTQNCETIIKDAPCTIGLRQGSFRANPYVIQYPLNTSDFLKGTYNYQIKIVLPNGQSRVSKRYILSIQ